MKRLAFLAATVALWVGPALAQSNCAARDAFETLMEDKLGARLIAGGMLQNGTQLQTWGNTETGIWAIVWTNGDVSCVQAEGGALYVVSPPPNL